MLKIPAKTILQRHIIQDSKGSGADKGTPTPQQVHTTAQLYSEANKLPCLWPSQAVLVPFLSLWGDTMVKVTLVKGSI